MKILNLFLMAVMLFIGADIFAQDMTLDGSGNVGIGTTTPTGKLEVAGTLNSYGIIGTSSGIGIGIYGENSASEGYAGYFQGNTRVTGNLILDGNAIGEGIGDITAVTAGTGLTGGGLSGSVSLDVNFAGTGISATSSRSDHNHDSTYLNEGQGSSVDSLMVIDNSIAPSDVSFNYAASSAKGGAATDINCTGCVSRGELDFNAGDGYSLDAADGLPVDAVYVDNNGNVGVGTISPQVLPGVDSSVLHIARPLTLPTDTATGIRIGIGNVVDGGITSAYNSTTGEGGVFVGTLSNHRFGLGTNSLERMTITPGGFVGIGTPSPLQNLHVHGSTYISDKLGVGVSSPTNNLQVNGSKSLFYSGIDDFRLAISKKADLNTASLIFQNNFAGHAELGLIGDNNFHVKVSPDGNVFTDAMFIDSASGMIGIGTMNPEGRLNVVATEAWQPAIYAETLNETSPAIYARKDGIGNAVHIRKMPGEAGSALEILQLGSDPALVIKNSTSQLMVVESTGKIGSGTSTPTAQLDVNGPTGYNQLRVRTSYTPTGTGDINGNVGDISWDDNYFYIKTSAGWKRSALAIF